VCFATVRVGFVCIDTGAAMLVLGWGLEGAAGALLETVWEAVCSTVAWQEAGVAKVCVGGVGLIAAADFDKVMVACNSCWRTRTDHLL
jgi:hypothetical protein